MGAYRLIIPTRDSSRWVGILLDAYRKLGVEPLYIVDMRSNAATFDALRARRADFLPFTPAGDFAEAGMIEFGARHAGTDWMLRMDDDEFPTAALLRWVATVGTASRNQAVALSSRQLFQRDGSIWYSRSPGRYSHAQAPNFLAPHVRLHHAGRVKYVQQVHSHGFADLALCSLAPPEAFFVHFNCLLRSPSERWRKIQRYEAIRRHSTVGVSDEYLPELFDMTHHRARQDGLEEFEPLFAALPKPEDQTSLDLDAATRAKLTAAVAQREAEIRAALSKRPRVISADDLAWLDRLPRRAWRLIAALLRSTSGHSSYRRRYGDAIRFYERMTRPSSPS